MARLIRGKLVGELGELKGMRQRELGDLKAFLTRRAEEWTPKYAEMSRIYQRRIVLIGTANEMEYLDDATGNRRHLPVMVGRSDLVALKRDLLQLWAEADALWSLEGVMWQDAARLAPTVHAHHEVSDPWEDAVAHWLEGSDDFSDPENGVRRCDEPDGIGVLELASGAVGVANGHVDRKVQLRLAKILRGLGYDKRVKKVHGVPSKRWFRPGHPYLE
jgi:predicted P-loop ATPase